jgi:hypothetical protein
MKRERFVEGLMGMCPDVEERDKFLAEENARELRRGFRVGRVADSLNKEGVEGGDNE